MIIQFSPHLQAGYPVAADMPAGVEPAFPQPGGAEPPAPQGVILTLGGGGGDGRVYGPDGKPADIGVQKSRRAEDKANQPCRECAERKYQDGSNDIGVSFKTATNVNPAAAGALVRAHEQEHVSNAHTDARKHNLNVQTSVSIHTDICPECKRVYVSGGSTFTRMTAKPQNPAELAEQYAKSMRMRA